jgi:hypothetical protein
MLVGATHKHGYIVGSSTPGDQNRLIGNQDLLQSISHGSIFGGPTRDSEQGCIFRRERFRIDTKISRRMDLNSACRANKDRRLQFRNLVSQRIEELTDAGLQDDSPLRFSLHIGYRRNDLVEGLDLGRYEENQF